ncbi:MAG: hypothetical protein ACFB9M_09285 [Myxococcota bacterium]
MNRIGIRREDKSKWERRVPLVPADLAEIRRSGGDIVVQTSQRRIFEDDDFRAAGVPVVESLDECDLIMGVKEVPEDLIQPETAYLFFSHTIKGQAHNMSMLRRLMDLGCTLIDYERITDEQGTRLVAFGRHAGLAGAVDSLWALGETWRRRGHPTPLAELNPAHRYDSLEAIRSVLREIGMRCRADEGFRQRAPVVVGVTGSGRVSRGVHEILDVLEPIDVEPEAIRSIKTNPGRFIRIRFEERHFAERLDGLAFDLQDYYANPDRYRGIFETRYVSSLSALINCIYWEARYPRLVTKSGIRAAFGRQETPRLTVIGDISCDIEGSIEATVKATDPAHPTFLWDAQREVASDGFVGAGPVIMAVDILPTELPRESSEAFSQALRPLMPSLLEHRFRDGVHGLHPALRRGVIVDRGQLCPEFEHLRSFLPSSRPGRKFDGR